MLGLFGKSHDWNIISIIFERADMYRVNGNRVKGKSAEDVRNKVKVFDRTLFWAVFDQKGAFLEGAPGAGSQKVQPQVIKKLATDLRLNKTVMEVLKLLETKASDKIAKPLEWNGYPAAKTGADDDA
jgi:hypothetical protein